MLDCLKCHILHIDRSLSPAQYLNKRVENEILQNNYDSLSGPMLQLYVLSLHCLPLHPIHREIIKTHSIIKNFNTKL